MFNIFVYFYFTAYHCVLYLLFCNVYCLGGCFDFYCLCGGRLQTHPCRYRGDAVWTGPTFGFVGCFQIRFFFFFFFFFFCECCVLVFEMRRRALIFFVCCCVLCQCCVFVFLRDQGLCLCLWYGPPTFFVVYVVVFLYDMLLCINSPRCMLGVC